MAKNYYEILGVDKKATQDEIKAQYRKLVKQYHPDLHPNDESVAAKFKEINEANEVLSDPDKRAKYDYELENPFASQAGGFSGGFSSDFGGFSDIFGDIFSSFTGGGSRGNAKSAGSDIGVTVTLSFMDAAKGCTKEVTYKRNEPCSSCKGTGAKDGTKYTTCDTCKGSGQVQQTSGGGFFRTVRVVTCPKCGGSGKNIIEKCPDCSGKGYKSTTTTINIDIPAGADTGSYITKRGYGNASTNGGVTGNLIVEFKVLSHKLLSRKGFDLYVDLPISFKTACLGGKVQVPTLDQPYELTIPEGTQNGKEFMVRGKGINSRYGIGNLYIKVFVEVPTKLSRNAKSQLNEFDSSVEIKQTSKMNDYKVNVQSLYGVNPYQDK